MKKVYTYMMAAAVAILAAGCAKETAPEASVSEGVVFEASLSETIDAKAILIPGKTSSKVQWEKGDQVGIYAGSAYYQYKADKSDASSTLSPVGASSLATEYYAVYPYDAAATLAGGVITTTLPSEQTAALESFSYHLAVAHSESLTLNFKNVCGLFVADVTEPGVVTKIEIKGNSNEDLAGKIAITVADTPSWRVVEGSKVVSISAPEGNTLQVGPYYMAVLPQEFAAGVTVTAYYKDGTTFVKNVQDKVTVAASGLVGGKIASGEWVMETKLTGLGNNPQDMILDSDGNFWVTRRSGVHGIYKYTIADNKYTLLSKTSDLLKDSHPWGAYAHNGTLYFAAKAVGKILKCDAQGNITQYLVNGQALSNPMKVLVDDSENVYILCRTQPSKVYKVKDGSVLATYTLPNHGAYGFEFMCFNVDKSKILAFPSDAGRIMQIDLSNGEIVQVAGTGTKHSSVSNYTDGTAGNPMTTTLGQCEGAICDADGVIYFTDAAAGKTIRMFIPDANGDYSKGTIRTIVGTPYDKTVLDYPNGIALAADGKTLYYAENAGQIRKVSYVKNE